MALYVLRVKMCRNTTSAICYGLMRSVAAFDWQPNRSAQTHRILLQMRELHSNAGHIRYGSVHFPQPVVVSSSLESPLICGMPMYEMQACPRNWKSIFNCPGHEAGHAHIEAVDVSIRALPCECNSGCANTWKDVRGIAVVDAAGGLTSAVTAKASHHHGVGSLRDTCRLAPCHLGVGHLGVYRSSFHWPGVGGLGPLAARLHGDDQRTASKDTAHWTRHAA